MEIRVGRPVVCRPVACRPAGSAGWQEDVSANRSEEVPAGKRPGWEKEQEMVPAGDGRVGQQVGESAGRKEHCRAAGGRNVPAGAWEGRRAGRSDEDEEDVPVGWKAGHEFGAGTRVWARTGGQLYVQHSRRGPGEWH
ncbi:hypothetical protein GDO81_006772 [Engystomops pustulosus]|uniref:Uncharacterized protein n=1 Tax=Engystomops pustulosus TaxID=76066 RepID=A0AAV7D0U1_ENGPU|nr:hypothetical protein GDO81_006772 [Engystomops pustulosus]